jgi:hypothetical protein
MRSFGFISYTLLVTFSLTLASACTFDAGGGDDDPAWASDAHYTWPSQDAGPAPTDADGPWQPNDAGNPWQPDDAGNPWQPDDAGNPWPPNDAGNPWPPNDAGGWPANDAGNPWPPNDAGPGPGGDAGAGGCSEITQEAVCVVTPWCEAVYVGINCQCDSTGNCVCDSWQFSSCQ